MDINRNIKLLCKEAGISFEDLANRLNITRQTLYRQSTGAAQLSTVERIANALNVPAWIILHPAPLEAIRKAGQVPGPAQADDSQGETTKAGTVQAARLLCPICGSRLQIQIRQDASHDPDSRTEGQQEGRPEE